MARMTPEEQAAFSKAHPGYHVKDKCDNCDKPIMGTLSYIASNGQEACSVGCKNALEGKRSDADENPTPKKNSSSKQKGDKNKKEKVKRMAKKEEKTAKKKAAKPEPKPAKKAAKPEKKAAKPEPKAKKAVERDDEPEVTKGNPFRPGSHISNVFEMCVEGTTLKAIHKYCEKNDVEEKRVMHFISRGTKNGTTWKYTEEDGDVKIKPGGVTKSAKKSKKDDDEDEAPKKKSKKSKKSKKDEDEEDDEPKKKSKKRGRKDEDEEEEEEDESDEEEESDEDEEEDDEESDEDDE